jgi:hypothetical protein
VSLRLSFGIVKRPDTTSYKYQDLEASGDVWVKFEQAQQEKALSAFEKFIRKLYRYIL